MTKAKVDQLAEYQWPRRAWSVWTFGHGVEAPRRGLGTDTLAATLDHLRERGDTEVRVQLHASAPIVVTAL